MSTQSDYIQTTKPSNSKIKWSKSKYIEMQKKIDGYWADDIWNPNENPFKDRNDIRGMYIYFNNISNIIKTEIKYACYQKMTTKEWKWITLHQAKAKKINYIIGFLSKYDNQINSLVDWQLEIWEKVFQEYLIENKKLSLREYRVIQKNGEYKNYKFKDETVYTFRAIYKIVFDYYDSRDEYEKDIWDLRKLNFSLNNLVDKNKFDFTQIKQNWLRNSSKKFLRYKLSISSTSLCRFRLYSLVNFSSFLEEEYPSIVPNEINRHLLLTYLSYLKGKYSNEQTRYKIITSLKDFIEISFREKWIDITGNQLIYKDDLPRYKRQRQPKYIPEIVLSGINRHLDKLENPVYQRMYLILISCGMRISELCSLSINCIKQDNFGDFFLQYHQIKMKKEITIPITREIVSIIQTQQQKAKEQFGNNVLFLFPSPKIKNRAITGKKLVDNINKLTLENNICDDDGNRWHFHPHQCRHTVGTNMINNGVPHHIVQKYLGHDSPTMTQIYAHIHDQTLKEEIAKYHYNRVVNVTGEVVESTTPELDNNLDLHLLKKKVLAQSLPNGSCARPIVLGECPHANACLTCGDFRTTFEFLYQHKAQLEETEKLVKNAEDKGWQRHAEMNSKVRDNLQKIITTLESGNKDVVSGGNE